MNEAHKRAAEDAAWLRMLAGSWKFKKAPKEADRLWAVADALENLVDEIMLQEERHRMREEKFVDHVADAYNNRPFPIFTVVFVCSAVLFALAICASGG